LDTKKLIEIGKWPVAALTTTSTATNPVNSFDLNSEFDELCCVTENGAIHFIRLGLATASSLNNSTAAITTFSNHFLSLNLLKSTFCIQKFDSYKKAYYNFKDSNELSCLNSVLYVKQFEIAVADSLGRVKLIDTRARDNKKVVNTFLL
jgi:hypothetical protein